MSARRLPEVPAAALRDYSSSAAVGRVFRRLESDLARRRPLLSRSYALKALAGLAIFASGVLVGARFFASAPPTRLSAEPLLRAERPAAHGEAAGGVPVAAPVASANPAEPRHVSRVTSLEAPALTEAPTVSLPAGDGEPLAAPSWQRLADLGAFAEARRSIDAQGGFDSAILSATPAQLMTLADIARATGERPAAVRCLRAVLHHPEAAEAPLAAWTLGNLLDQSGDRQGAADAFGLYRRLSPRGDFAEDAAARQIDVALSQANVDLVTELVEDYARNFPHGRRLAEFEKALGALRSAADAAVAPGALGDDPELDADEAAAAGSAEPTPSAEPEPH